MKDLILQLIFIFNRQILSKIIEHWQRTGFDVSDLMNKEFYQNNENFIQTFLAIIRYVHGDTGISKARFFLDELISTIFMELVFKYQTFLDKKDEFQDINYAMFISKFYLDPDECYEKIKNVFTIKNSWLKI